MNNDETLKTGTGEKRAAKKGCRQKHPCVDCSFCQWCGDDRCRLCRAPGRPEEKPSLAEQIAAYNRRNREILD